MSLDIRTPIGYFFTLIGVLLVVFGLSSDPKMYEEHSLGINVNLWWGLVLGAFGAFMLAMAWRAGRFVKGRSEKRDTET
ncbi:MAG: hypothetical protein ACUVUC_02505 [Thermoguttaceae bacterium]